MIWTENELVTFTLAQLRKLAKYYQIPKVYKMKKGEIIDTILRLFPNVVDGVSQSPEGIQRSVRVRRIYGEKI